MKINKQTLLSFLLLSVSPTMCATLGGSTAGGGEEVKVAENFDASLPNTAIEATSWGSSLIPFYILEGIQSAYLPSALRMTGMVQAFLEPNPSPPADFWDQAVQVQEKLQVWVHDLLEAAAAWYKSTHFTDVASAMNDIVNATAAFRHSIQGSEGVLIETLTKELEASFTAIVNDLEMARPDVVPASHAERVEMVDKVLNNTMQALIDLAERHGIDKEVVRTYLLALEPSVRVLIVTIGDINEEHPELLPGLVFSVAVLLIPEAWLLRPFLSIFGFGPYGPVKGSAAAWMQRVFWGAAVEAGSWFSWLQAAGMGVLPRCAWFVTKLPLLVAAALLGLLPCFRK